jgi:hypothetical protein
MSDGHWGGTATLLQNGEVLVAGGSNQFTTIATAELFNPAAGTWMLTGRNCAYPTALLIAFGPDYHGPPNGSASEIRSKPRLSRCGRTS